MQRQFRGEMIVFSINDTITTVYPHAKKNLASMPHTISKN